MDSNGEPAKNLIDSRAIIDYSPLNTGTESSTMARITIRNLEDDIAQGLRVRAAEHGCSMEEEARDILRRAFRDRATPRNLAAAIRARVAPADRVDLELPAREPTREPPQSNQARSLPSATSELSHVSGRVANVKHRDANADATPESDAVQ